MRRDVLAAAEAASGEELCGKQTRRPEASAKSPPSTPRQRQIKLRAASSLGHSLAHSLCQSADMLWLACHTGPVFHIGEEFDAQWAQLYAELTGIGP